MFDVAASGRSQLLLGLECVLCLGQGGLGRRVRLFGGVQVSLGGFNSGASVATYCVRVVQRGSASFHGGSELALAARWLRRRRPSNGFRLRRSRSCRSGLLRATSCRMTFARRTGRRVGRSGEEVILVASGRAQHPSDELIDRTYGKAAE